MLRSDRSDNPKIPARPNGTDGTRRGRFGKFAATLIYLVYLVVAVSAIFLVFELGLLLAFIFTASPTFATLDSASLFVDDAPLSEYPERPDDYIKIAAFGGSAAAGTYSPRSFVDVLEAELRRQFPNQKFFIENHASDGTPFHRYQAEYVKLLIDKYDFFLIYCGNNEAENWFEDSGFWRHPEFKDARDLRFTPPPELQSPTVAKLRRELERRSRVYAVISRVKMSFRARVEPISKNRNLDFDQFEDGPALPPAEREKLIHNFGNDIAEIGRLAKRHGKQVLLAVSATYETWPPCFSYFRPDITPDERRQWRAHFDRATQAMELRQHDAATTACEQASQIDSGVAILNHRRGLHQLQLGNPAEARRLLRLAIDQDGFYSRSITPLHDTARQLARENDHLHYVDVVAALHTILEKDIDDDELFMDFCHPTLLGHVVMGHVFAEELLRFPPFHAAQPSGKSQELTERDWRAAAAQFEREDGIDAGDWAEAISTNIFWYFNMVHFMSDRDRVYEMIGRRINQLEQLDTGNVDDPVFAQVSRARLSLIRQDKQAAAAYLNAAHQLSPIALQKSLRLVAWNRLVADEFEEAGIRFSAEQQSYLWPAADNDLDESN